jgi:hypothetical protein
MLADSVKRRSKHPHVPCCATTARSWNSGATEMRTSMRPATSPAASRAAMTPSSPLLAPLSLIRTRLIFVDVCTHPMVLPLKYGSASIASPAPATTRVNRSNVSGSSGDRTAAAISSNAVAGPLVKAFAPAGPTAFARAKPSGVHWTLSSSFTEIHPRCCMYPETISDVVRVSGRVLMAACTSLLHGPGQGPCSRPGTAPDLRCARRDSNPQLLIRSQIAHVCRFL